VRIALGGDSSRFWEVNSSASFESSASRAMARYVRLVLFGEFLEPGVKEVDEVYSIQPSLRASSFAASQASFSNSSRLRGHSLSIWMSEDW
jgi:hypothetical protein